jgi:hypothetical protein
MTPKNSKTEEYDENCIFTSQNLLQNLHNLGPWSSYGLASVALSHYFPEEYSEDESPSAQRETELLTKLKCEYWEDAIVKYHTEVGYTDVCLSERGRVNGY